MGYMGNEKGYEDTISHWLLAVKKAWRYEAREKGDRMVLADVLERAIRDSTIAIRGNVARRNQGQGGPETREGTAITSRGVIRNCTLNRRVGLERVWPFAFVDVCVRPPCKKDENTSARV